MIITKKSLPRRTFLRGMSATLALPLLDAMVPAASALAKTPAAPAIRMGFIYTPHGVIQEQWVPNTVGTGFEVPAILKPIDKFREQLLIVSGLAHRQADSFGDGNGDHQRSTAAWLSGEHAWERRMQTEARELRLGTTADQFVAREFGKYTLLPSIELTLETPTAIACDSGDCFYSNTISWRTPTTPLPMEPHPRMVFERLFGEGGSPAERRTQLRQTGSILDSVRDEALRIEQSLGPKDRSKLSEYLEAVRDVEQRIQRAETNGNDSSIALPERPVDIPEAFNDHAKIMFDLQVLAFQADITRVASLMMARELSPRTYPEIGVTGQHHQVSHHRNDPDLIGMKAKIDAYHIELLGHFLERLQATPDGDGSLLDHAIILYGSGMGNGNLHEHTNLPALVAGGGAGRLRTGRHLAYPEDTPKSNLLLSLMDKAGVPVEKLGDSTGQLSLQELSGV